MRNRLLIGAFCLAVIVTAATKFPLRAWVAKSDRDAAPLLEIFAAFHPEEASSAGVASADRNILDQNPHLEKRYRAEYSAALKELSRELKKEKDPEVRLDLGLLEGYADGALQTAALEGKYLIPFTDVAAIEFQGIQVLLREDVVSADKESAAAIRLRKYAGLEGGDQPLGALARNRTLARVDQAGLVGPPTSQVEQALKNSAVYLKGIGDLAEKHHLVGSKEACGRIASDLAEYDKFLRDVVLPHARKEFRLPAELYGNLLLRYGVKLPPEELAAKAHGAYAETQAEMQPLAAAIALERKMPSSDYRDVIRELKKAQLGGDTILAHYKQRVVEVENIIRKERLVTLPRRPTVVRLASPAESAANPSPYAQLPALLGNHGDRGGLVLPYIQPGVEPLYDDDTYAAASWTLVAHEVRPGHELQWAEMLQQRLSIARSLFAFNAANVEGWALYSERIVRPFMPPDGKLISLQNLLLREARAFLDPELQAGTITPAAALRVLTDDVVISPNYARQEVERYTFRQPGQAPAYFYGYLRMTGLREEVEHRMGSKFDAQKFHDLVLKQGLLPPEQLRTAIIAAIEHEEK